MMVNVDYIERILIIHVHTFPRDVLKYLSWIIVVCKLCDLLTDMWCLKYSGSDSLLSYSSCTVHQYDSSVINRVTVVENWIKAMTNMNLCLLNFYHSFIITHLLVLILIKQHNVVAAAYYKFHLLYIFWIRSNLYGGVISVQSENTFLKNTFH